MVTRQQRARGCQTIIKALFSAALLGLVFGPLTLSAREAVGVTLAARGEVEATDLVALDVRSLSRRSDVFDVDALTTGPDSQAQLRMRDDAVLSLRPNSELIIAEYQYNADTGEGKAILELVSGGLRTLTGRISAELADTDFELRTSVGTIGIRGTHFEVIEGADRLFLAVWDGEIDIAIAVGNRSGRVVTLGPNANYSFAEIGLDGEVTYLMTLPDVFAEGHTDDGIETDVATTLTQTEADNEISLSLTPATLLALDQPPVPDVPRNLVRINLPTPPDVVADRTGTVTYDDLLAVDLESNINYDMSLSFSINFSEGTVDDGTLSLIGDNSEWFAVFDGGISGNDLQLGNSLGSNQSFNFASHTRDDSSFDAAGNLSGQFFGPNAEQVRGEFDLFEVNAPETSVSGSYLIGGGEQ